MAIKENTIRNKLRFSIILRIREALFSCHQKGLSICLVWTLGHSGIPGNETADSCAKSAVICGTLKHFNNLVENLVSLAKKYLEKVCNNTWNLSKSFKRRHYAAHQDEIPKNEN